MSTDVDTGTPPGWHLDNTLSFSASQGEPAAGFGLSAPETYVMFAGQPD